MGEVALVLATSTGGVGGHVTTLVEGLVERGWAVRVLGPTATDHLFGFSARGARFLPVEIASGPGLLDDARAQRALARAIRGVDVVHAHGLRAGLLAGLTVRGGTPPLVVTWHNAVLDQGLRRVVYAVLERVVARRATVTLVASADLGERAHSLGARDVRLAPVAAPALPSPTRARADLRAELGAGDRPLVLAVGRLHHQKGFDVLIRSAALWRDRVPQPLVVVAGDGPERAALQRLVDERRSPVVLLGRRTDVADLMAAADVVVLSSRWEARSLAAQEALRAGVPLVATRVGGIPDLVDDAAVLVPPEDARALASAIERVLVDETLRTRLCHRARDIVSTWPTTSDTVEQVLSLYLELTVGHR